jgi:hypothetical protein
VVISGHQWSSKFIRVHQSSSEVIRGHQRSSEVISAPARETRRASFERRVERPETEDAVVADLREAVGVRR